MTYQIEDKFEYPVLTKVHGPLTYTALKIIKDELKPNAASIHSDLGGGSNGNLGMVENPVLYTHISATPYVKHLHPPPLIIPVGDMQHLVTGLRKDHNEARKLFK